jgi:hypothetical protein
MARISDLNSFNIGRRDNDFETLKFENKEGDVMIVKPQEVRDVLNDYLTSEINSLGDDIKSRIKDQLDFKIKQVENKLTDHIEDKILRLTERILDKTINRVIEDEVNRRVMAKLEKIKKEL